jgi:hypothetical protein
MVVVVSAFPEYAVAGGGVLIVLRIFKGRPIGVTHTVLVIDVSVVKTSVTAGAVKVVVVEIAIDARVVEVHASAGSKHAPFSCSTSVTYLATAWRDFLLQAKHSEPNSCLSILLDIS